MKVFNTLLVICAFFTLACADGNPSDTQPKVLFGSENGAGGTPSFDPMAPQDQPSDPATPIAMEPQDQPSEPETPITMEPQGQEEPPLPFQIDFRMEEFEGLEFNSGAVWEELCDGEDTITRTMLVLTEWQITCDGPVISEAPDHWTAVVIVLEDRCGFDPQLETATQTTEYLENGNVSGLFSQTHTHDVRIKEIQRHDATDETDIATVSVDIDIFERFEAEGGNVIGSLQGILADCGTQTTEGRLEWWEPAPPDLHTAYP